VRLATVLGGCEKLYASLLRGSSQVLLLAQRYDANGADHNLHPFECIDQGGRLFVVYRSVLETLGLPIRVTGTLGNEMLSGGTARDTCYG
jgi:hypothetical protein